MVRQKTSYTYLRKARKRRSGFVSLFLSLLDKFPSKFSGISIVSEIRLDVFVNLEKKLEIESFGKDESHQLSKICDKSSQ